MQLGKKGQKKTHEHYPAAEGRPVTLTVEGLNHDGEGVARFEGLTIFVPGALPGDLVSARVISRKKAYARALVEEVLKPSPARVSPRCPHHGLCGGCRLQHLAYEEQLVYKKGLVEDALRRLGGMKVPVLPVIGMEAPWRYRNKAQVPVAWADGRVLAGFYQRRSHTVVDTETCPVQLLPNDEVIRAARRAIQRTGVPIYNEKDHTGTLRHVIARTSRASGETLIILVTKGRELPGKEELLKDLSAGTKNLVGIVQNVNPRRGNKIFGQEDITLWGRGYLEEKLGGLTFRISPQSFFQVNSSQAEILLEKVREYGQLTGEETVFDLYCGTGAIALYISRFARRVIGVESVAAAVEDARQNARLNGITNAEFILGRSEEAAPRLAKEGYAAHVVIVDPPRGGCRPELLETIITLNPEKVVYVSCNPATLARDLKYLAKGGYRAIEAQPVDMFPHTSHVETVVLLESK